MKSRRWTRSVVSVTQFHAGNAYNVIPSVAELKGTVRCLSNTVREGMPAKMERIAAGICAAFRAEYEFTYESGPPVVVNDAALTELVQAVGHDILAPGGVTFLETPTMGAEDFAYYLLELPGVMFRLGVGTNVTALHTPTYNFSDGALPYGIGMLATSPSGTPHDPFHGRDIRPRRHALQPPRRVPLLARSVCSGHAAADRPCRGQPRLRAHL